MCSFHFVPWFWDFIGYHLGNLWSFHFNSCHPIPFKYFYLISFFLIGIYFIIIPPLSVHLTSFPDFETSIFFMNHYWGGNYPPFHGSGGCGINLQCFIWALWDHHQPLTCPAFPAAYVLPVHSRLTGPHQPMSCHPKQGRACCALLSLLQQHSLSTAAGWAVFNYPPWTFVRHNQQLIANNQTNWWSREIGKSDRGEPGLKQEPTPVMGMADGKQLFGVEGAHWKRSCHENQSISSFLCPWRIFTSQLTSGTSPPL